MSPLESRYRRLLACYPRDHLARHGEEMIGVLMAGVRPGQTRPHPADVADLLWGALRVHGRRAFGPVSAPAWRDGLALAVALWPFLMLADALATELLTTSRAVHTVGVPVLAQSVTIRFLAEDIAAAALPALAVRLGHRWIAALGAVAFVLYQVAHPHLLAPGTLLLPNHAFVLLAKVAAIAIAFVPAAHRAITRIPRHAFLVWGPLALAGLTAAKALVRWVDVTVYQDVVAWKPVPWLVVVALAAGYACRSAVGRRAALCLFVPAAALGDLGDLPFVPTSTALAQIGCTAVAFAVMAVVAGRLRRPAGAATGR
ncbi:hypothetical protein AB0O28_36115 [Microbispora sp. NPDC088329]|uniref:hypothetical protein n=1 Tax=Microbispora sp. NPDC088329 TaxID=3154869 RepID=UPI003412B74F